jgi:hypothetical protein
MANIVTFAEKSLLRWSLEIVASLGHSSARHCRCSDRVGPVDKTALQVDLYSMKVSNFCPSEHRLHKSRVRICLTPPHWTNSLVWLSGRMLCKAWAPVPLATGWDSGHKMLPAENPSDSIPLSRTHIDSIVIGEKRKADRLVQARYSEIQPYSFPLCSLVWEKVGITWQSPQHLPSLKRQALFQKPRHGRFLVRFTLERTTALGPWAVVPHGIRASQGFLAVCLLT